ncbi:GNAT family N-acetyltransferase [Eudoraea chungangensis]|uniref:GNAT family N-acetyltransferase n=1 Tax=Eudoraea chungangensis TaxID=1481905 RepID=UPI0023ED77F3|nr:GNAT family N-acetyltransferase [Eudoraea chungangensis]
MGLIVRKAEPKDMADVLSLIKELASFEKEDDAVEVTINDLLEDGFGSSALYHCFVAEVDEAIAGTAIVYPRYSTWKGQVLHLEDLIVSERFRGLGIGSALLTAVVEYGAALKVKRISWEVLDWNAPAIAFYEKKGAKVLRDWDVVQLNESGIKEFLENNESI